MQEYYNTNKLNPEDLATAEVKAKKQKDIILDYFKARPFMLFTPPQIWRLTGLKEKGAPLTSVRRAISNLTDGGPTTNYEPDLIKTQQKVIGDFKTWNHRWTLNTKKYLHTEVPGQQLTIVPETDEDQTV